MSSAEATRKREGERKQRLEVRFPVFMDLLGSLRKKALVAAIHCFGPTLSMGILKGGNIGLRIRRGPGREDEV